MKWFILFGVLLPTLCYAQLSGKVVSIADGDTFTMLINNKQVKVRLHGIDCPEKGQDFYQVAKDFLSSQIFNKTVQVRKTKTDRYRRVVGIVTIDDVVVNEKMLEAGLAWHYGKYDKNPAWKKLEQTARQKKAGLWKLANPTPPWEFRKRKIKQ